MAYLPEPRKEQRHRVEQIERLQLDRPTAGFAEREQLVHVRHQQRHQHVAHDQYRADPGVIADDDHHRGDHFTDKHPISKKTRQAIALQRTGNPAHPAFQLGDAVQQQQQPQGQAQNQFAQIGVLHIPSSRLEVTVITAY